MHELTGSGIRTIRYYIYAAYRKPLAQNCIRRRV